MTEKPIIFSDPMVRAVFDGRKTQTRRVVNPQPYLGALHAIDIGDGRWRFSDRGDGCGAGSAPVRCPYGRPGGLLWVRECWGVGTRPDPGTGWRDGIEYRADEAYLDGKDLLPLYPVDESVDLDRWSGSWRPSIHMPKWACRLWLRAVSVRVERVQSISAVDSAAEGVGEVSLDERAQCGWSVGDASISRFRQIWDSLNARRGFGWNMNPWVWVLEFERTEAP
jgi:hypothetical protein